MNGSGAIDVHAHYAPPAYLVASERYAARDPLFAKLNATVPGRNTDALHGIDRRIAEMDAAGVALQVLSMGPRGGFPADAAVATELSVTGNDGLLDACARHPGRFLMMANLPFPHVDAALAELERLKGRRALRGVCLSTGAVGYTPDRPEWRPVLERIAALRLPLLLHPSSIDAAGSSDDFVASFADFNLMSAVQIMTGTSVCALRLAYSGSLDAIPGLDVIVPHLGGVIPYLTQRLLDQARGGTAAYDLTHYLRNRFYYDSCSFHEPALVCAVETAGAGRVMVGSDYPLRGALARAVESLNGSALPDDAKRAIGSETARRWFAPDPPRQLSDNAQPDEHPL